MTNYAIRIEKISKRYRIGRKLRNQNFTETLQSDFGNAVRSISQRFMGKEENSNQPSIWALQNVCFDVKEGESVGIIGNNGSGKTTLLKILSRITTPTRGKARLWGRVGSLLEVGTGFHPELTGRENIYLNGSILGMRRREISAKLDEIVDFSEIEEFLDTPVKFYSSGMRMRLAFSVAAHLEPEILLVDEVLAVGDIAFQRKSLKKMGSAIQGGRTVLFVSHNMAAIKALCQTGAFLERGELKYHGEVASAVDAYLNQGALQQATMVQRQANPALTVQFMQIKAVFENTLSAGRFGHDDAVSFEITVDVRELSYRTYLRMYILEESLDILLATYDVEMDQASFTSRKPGSYTYRVQLPKQLLAPGNYRVSLYAIMRHNRFETILDRIEHVCPFEVVDNGSFLAQAGIQWKGHIAMPSNWEVLDCQPLDKKSETAKTGYISA